MAETLTAAPRVPRERRRGTFFTPAGVEHDEHGRAVPPRASTPRSMVAAGERINLSKKGADRVDKRPPQTWQTEAWRYFDAVGEVHYAFELIGQVVGRVRLYVAVIDQPDQAPTQADDYLFALEEKAGEQARVTRQVIDDAQRILRGLLEEATGGASQMMRRMAINLSVPGEAYLVRDKDNWLVCSSDELVQSNDKLKIRKNRSSKKNDQELPANAFAARIWRSHPRFASEPDSSMVGVLDQLEMLVLLEQACRVQTRSRLNAGVVFVPEGLTPVAGGDESVEAILTRAATTAAEDESAAITVTPLVLTGPAELGKELKRIELGRMVDDQTIELIQKTLDRILTGIDVPKDIIRGLAEIRYSNAVVIDDNLYKSHIEPLCLLIADAITEVYLRPALKALEEGRRGTGPGGVLRIPGTNGQAPARRAQEVRPSPADDFAIPAQDPFDDIVSRVVVWIDPSEIVVRPDRSQAANEGYDRHVLSAAAWRSARGFAEGDAPSNTETLQRIAVERAPVSPDTAQVMIESLDPEFFAEKRAEGQAQAGVPEDVSSLLEGQGSTPGEPPPAGAPPSQTEPLPPKGEPRPTPAAQQQAGGPVNPQGTQPPRVPVPAR